MIRCPLCFSDLTSAPTAFLCTGTCDENPDPIASAFTGGTHIKLRPVLSAPTGFAPPSLECSTCHVETWTRACPRCHFVLPRHWFSGQTTCLAMAGARTSGKSVYIAVMKKQLERLAHEFGGVLKMDDPGQVFSMRYERPLYEARGIIEPTPALVSHTAPQRSPIIFTLSFPGRPPTWLVVRDVAGEDLETLPHDTRALEFFPNADAIFFLFDPLRIAAIRQMLAGLIAVQEVGAEPSLVMSNMATLVGTQFGAGEPVKVPLALTLSKLDALQQLGNVDDPQWGPLLRNYGAAYMRDPSTSSFEFDEQDSRLLDLEMRSLLDLLNGRGVLNQAEQVFPEVRLFAVSALGHSPVGARLGARGIAPQRCLDPVKWALARTGVIAVRA